MPEKKRRTSGNEGYENIPIDELVMGRGQPSSKNPIEKKERRKPDTVSGEPGTDPDKKNKNYKSSKDDRKANRNKEVVENLTPFQTTDTDSENNDNGRREARNKRKKETSTRDSASSSSRSSSRNSSTRSTDRSRRPDKKRERDD